MLENTVGDGNYTLELTTCKNNKPQDPFILEFEKKSKVETASAKKYKLNDSIYKVEVNITAKEDGQVFIYAVTGDTEKLVASSDISKGENKVYIIDNSKVDLNDKKMNIKVVVN